MKYDHHCRELLRYIEDFYTDYLQDLKIRMEEQQAKKQDIARDSMNRLANDLNEAKISKET